ncbi:MAG: PTS glucose transporter subunit IIA, partial [Selenomonadaceae bacterium]|nr:PTS glucose transporter subunit IIA [Selenomonadaceae bacterium]
FFLQDLGGKSNIVDVTNCATRLRVTVKDDSKIASVATFTEHGAHGLVHNGRAIQVIVGLSVPQVRERFETLLNSPDAEPVPAATPAPTATPVTSGVNTSAHVEIKAVVSGKVIDMSEVPDAMFSQKMMGDGVAIEPDEETIKAPADAEITMVMDDSKHAVGLKFSNGAEMLIHIGIDTVNLKGEGFKLLTKSGAKVKAGDPLVKIDRKVIANAGYKDVVVMAITNSADFPNMKKETGKKVKATEDTVINF